MQINFIVKYSGIMISIFIYYIIVNIMYKNIVCGFPNIITLLYAPLRKIIISLFKNKLLESICFLRL